MADQSILQPGNLLMVQERERYLSKLLREHGIDSLDHLRAFEAGCSTGYNLRLFLQWGARPENLAGIDLDPAAVDYNRAHAPQIRVHSGSAADIPETDATFDIALAFTLFSSVADEDVSQRIANELFRITRPGGLIVIYDMRRKNPRNQSVHPILASDIRRWFPKCPVRMHRVTLAPPIARPVGRLAPWLYGPLAAISPLRSHAIYVLRRPFLPPPQHDAQAMRAAPIDTSAESLAP